jgi:hypothetical protein
VYTARKERLLRRMPGQPMRAVRRPRAAAMVETISSERLPTRITSACVQTLNQVRRQKMSPTSV